MNVNTYDATPLLDEVLTVPRKDPKVRVFNDGGTLYNLWFELAPDQFWCGQNYSDARDTHRDLPSSGVSLETLRRHFGSRGSLY